MADIHFALALNKSLVTRKLIVPVRVSWQSQQRAKHVRSSTSRQNYPLQLSDWRWIRFLSLESALLGEPSFLSAVYANSALPRTTHWSVALQTFTTHNTDICSVQLSVLWSITAYRNTPSQSQSCCRIWDVPLTVLLYRAAVTYEGWNFNSGNYLFTTDTK